MLKFLIIFFSVIYLFGLLGRWFIKKWFVNLSQQNQANTQQKSKEEGEVTIDYREKTNKKMDPSEGEYVDYEEIK